MKIGYFTSIEGWGGSEMYLLRLMRGVRDRGHDVVMFGVEGTRLWEEAGKAGIESIAWRSIQTLGVRCETLGVGRETLDVKRGRWEVGGGMNDSETSAAIPDIQSGLWSVVCGLRSGMKRALLRLMPGSVKLLLGNLREVLHLGRVFRTHRVDVMHVNVHGYEVAGVACRMVGIPAVGVYCNSFEPLHSRFTRFLQRNTIRYIDAIVGKSNYCLQSWLCNTRFSENRGHVVYNGISVSCNLAQKQSGGMIRFVSAGRLDPVKGYDLLIDAFAALKERDVELIIAGEGSQRDALEQKVAGHRLERQVSLPGHVENIEAFLAEADVFVLPSISHESFGQSVVEAMAAGLPVITSDFGPFPEINVDGVTGIVVPTGEIDALRDALKWLVGHPEEGRAMGGAGQERVARVFSHKVMIDKMMAIYKELHANG